MNNRFEISILRGSDKEDAKLEGMTLEVAKAFLTLVDSVTKIVETSLNKDDLKIKIEKGSVRVAIEGNGITEIKNNLFQSINQTTTDKDLVKPWRTIQTLILANGLDYTSQIILGDERIPVLSLLKSAKPIRAKRTKNPPLKVPIDFIIGKLIQVGGKNPNIHVELEGGVRETVECSEAQANAAKDYLYKNIIISTWTAKRSEKKVHTLCESYYYDELDHFKQMRDFIFELENAEDEISSLEKLHFECRRYLDNKDYRGLNKFLRLFKSNIINISILHTILMLTVSFQDNPVLKSTLQDLNLIFEGKLNSQNKNVRSVSQKVN